MYIDVTVTERKHIDYKRITAERSMVLENCIRLDICINFLWENKEKEIRREKSIEIRVPW